MSDYGANKVVPNYVVIARAEAAARAPVGGRGELDDAGLVTACPCVRFAWRVAGTTTDVAADLSIPGWPKLAIHEAPA
jgi:hypothetical protein